MKIWCFSILSFLAVGIMMLTVSAGYCAETSGEVVAGDEGDAEDSGDDLTAMLEQKRILALEKTVGSGAGSAGSTDLVRNVRIEYGDETFEDGTKVAAYYIDEKLPLKAYRKIGPIWYIAPSTKPKRKVKFTFDYEEEVSLEEIVASRMWTLAQHSAGLPTLDLPIEGMPGKGTTIVVLVWWQGAWTLAGFPAVDEEKRTVTVETDYWGYFVPVRTKVRDDVTIRKYTYLSGKKPNVEVIGLFRYDSKCTRGEDTLQEKLDFAESYFGTVEFGVLDRVKRVGVKVLDAKSVGAPKVMDFSGELKMPDSTVYATSYEISKEPGIVWAKESAGMLRFDGLPTLILLKGFQGDKEGFLPTMRGNVSFNGIMFDWKWQEMFQLGNFVYIATLTMPHGTQEEMTVLRLYLQFIVRQRPRAETVH